jgi:hypothetical protein
MTRRSQVLAMHLVNVVARGVVNVERLDSVLMELDDHLLGRPSSRSLSMMFRAASHLRDEDA